MIAVIFGLLVVVIFVLIVFLWGVWKDELQDISIEEENNLDVNTKTINTSLFEKGLQDLDIQNKQLLSVKDEISRHIIGMDNFVNTILINIMTGGHLLVEGVPGLAKTRTIEVISNIFDMDFSRIQFTPDMIPSDITGVQIYNSKTGDFQTKKGPVFANIVLADEINRTTPKVQSALLEAMQEKIVSIGNESYSLPNPFFVLATQNPLEQEGTYPLPEAQLDRFMFKVDVTYPNIDEEKKILDVVENQETRKIDKILDTKELISLQNKVHNIKVSDKIRDYIVRLASATRNENNMIEYGVSPRGAISLFKASKAIAYLQNRDYVIYEDVQRIVLSVFSHRFMISYQAKVDGYSKKDILLNCFGDVDLV